MPATQSPRAAAASSSQWPVPPARTSCRATSSRTRRPPSAPRGSGARPAPASRTRIAFEAGPPAGTLRESAGPCTWSPSLESAVSPAASPNGNRAPRSTCRPRGDGGEDRTRAHLVARLRRIHGRDQPLAANGVSGTSDGADVRALAAPEARLRASRLEQLDGVARRILDDDLLAAHARDYVVAEARAPRLEPLHRRLEVVHLDREAVPATGRLLRAVRHGLAASPGGIRRAEHEAKLAPLEHGEGGDRVHDLTETELPAIERDSGVDVVHDVADADTGHGSLPGDDLTDRISRSIEGSIRP